MLISEDLYNDNKARPIWDPVNPSSDSVEEGFFQERISPNSYISKGANVFELLPIGYSWCWTGNEKKYILIQCYIP